MSTTSLPFEPCSSICISGMSGSGKSYLTFEFLKNLKYMYSETPPIETIYCYGIHQPLFDEMERTIPNFTSRRGLLSSAELDELTSDRQHRLIIVDDLAHEVLQNPDMELLFTQGCHHRKISVIFITQNLYGQGKHARTIALNTWYLILMKNMRDVSQISTLGRQLFPGKAKTFVEAYQDALKRPYGYLVVDTSPHGDDAYRIRTDIFPGQDPVIYTV